MSEETLELDQLGAALAAFQAVAPVIPNTERARIKMNSGGDYGYSYADLGTIVPIVLPLLAQQGLSFTALPTRTHDGAALLVGMLLHSSGQRITGELPITGRTPQEIGSSLTYGRRYLLCCLTGVVTDDDDDGRLAERAARAVSGGLSQAAAEHQRTERDRATGPTQRDVPRPGFPPPAASAGSDPEPPVETTEATTSERSYDPDESPLLNTSSKLAKAMYAAIREAGIERDRVHDFLSEVTGRNVASSKELTEAEAHKVLDYLPAQDGQP